MNEVTREMPRYQCHKKVCALKIKAIDLDIEKARAEDRETDGSATITPEEAVTFAHASGSAVTDQAEVASPAFGCVTFSRLRVVVDNAGGGQTVAAEVAYTTYDSDGAT